MFSIGAPQFSQGVRHNDPIKALKAVLIEAAVCDPAEGHQPGNPQFFQSSAITLDSHWRKIKETAPELTDLHTEAQSQFEKALQAIADNDISRAVCCALSASCIVAEMKLLQVAAAELEGIRVALGRLTRTKLEEREDRERFQAACRRHWTKHPETRIRGENGIMSIIRPYLSRAYDPKTLENWASEVAPPAVKKRSGRPRKE